MWGLTWLKYKINKFRVWLLAFSFGLTRTQNREMPSGWGCSHPAVAAAVGCWARLDNREAGKGKGRRRQHSAGSVAGVGALPPPPLRCCLAASGETLRPPCPSRTRAQPRRNFPWRLDWHPSPGSKLRHGLGPVGVPSFGQGGAQRVKICSL